MAKIGSTIALVGDKELQKTLLKLTDAAARQVMRPAVGAGLRPIREAARQNAAPGAALSPEASGLLRKSIFMTAKSKKDNVVGKVFVTRKIEGTVDGKRHVPGNIAHLVEFGHLVKNVKGGPVVGVAAAHPFMRPAMDTKKGEAMKLVENKAREMLPKVVDKLRSKGKAVNIGELGQWQ